MSWKVLKIHKTGLIPVKKVPETHDRINRVYRKDLYRTYVGRMQDLISDSADRSENVLNREYKERGRGFIWRSRNGTEARMI